MFVHLMKNNVKIQIKSLILIFICDFVSNLQILLYSRLNICYIFCLFYVRRNDTEHAKSVFNQLCVWLSLNESEVMN